MSQQRKIVALLFFSGGSLFFWLHHFGPEIIWHRLGFLFLSWWLFFLFARLFLSRRRSFGLALWLVAWLWLRLSNYDNGWRLLVWGGSLLFLLLKT